MSHSSNEFPALHAESNSFGQQRSILHLDLDTFFVSVERRMDSRLEGRPILIGGRAIEAWWRPAVTKRGGLGCIPECR